MIIETLTILSMLAGGAALLRIAGLRGWGLPVLGASTGLALYISIGAVQVFTPISTSPVLTIALTAGIPILAWLWLFIRGNDVRIKLLPSLVVIAGVIGLIALLRPQRLTNWSYDSLRYIINGSLIASDNFDQASMGLVPKRLIGVPLIHASGNLGGDYFLASITPLIAGIVVMLVAWLAWIFLSPRLSRWNTIGLIAAGLIFLITINRFIFHAFYLNGHMLVGLLLLAIVGCSWLLAIDAQVSKNVLLIVISLSIIALVVTRAEGFILVGLALLPMLLDKGTPTRFRSIPLAALGLSTIAWQVFVAFVYLEQDLEVPFSVTGLMLAGICVLTAIPVLRWAPVTRNGGILLRVAEAALWILLLLLILRRPEIFLESVGATISNVVLGAGSWGFSLMMLLALMVVVIFLRVPGESRFRFPLTTFIPFAFLLAYLRDAAFRVGDGDSLNRLWIQLIPIAVLYLIVAIGVGQQRWPKRAQSAVDAVGIKA